jgi:hypothetical protein
VRLQIEGLLGMPLEQAAMQFGRCLIGFLLLRMFVLVLGFNLVSRRAWRDLYRGSANRSNAAIQTADHGGAPLRQRRPGQSPGTHGRPAD